jgi:hypothetical protein
MKSRPEREAQLAQLTAKGLPRGFLTGMAV